MTQEFELRAEDLLVTHYDPDRGRARYTLNQNRGVQLTHKPTGITVSAESGSLQQNRALAAVMLTEKVRMDASAKAEVESIKEKFDGK